MDSETPEQLADRIALRRERFREVVDDIRAVLREDLPDWAVKQTRAAFLAHPEIAEELDKEQVVALKQRAAEVGAARAADVDTALSDLALWESVQAQPEDRKGLAEATEIWSVVRGVPDALRVLLLDFGLASEAPPAYRAPVYFVSGRYFPALAEHYWGLLAEIRDLTARCAELDISQQRERLEAKWDHA